MKDNRFQVDKETRDSLSAGSRIITATRTGAQYLFVHSGYAGRLTGLADKNGMPMINKGE